jgi:hypothetical protein
MKYCCSCGNNSEITYSNFKQGQRCIKCSGLEKHTFEDVKNYFNEQSCELLETEYINFKTKMKYRCSCSNDSYVISKAVSVVQNVTVMKNILLNMS